MHLGRILALVGAVVGVAGLAFPGATTEGEELLPALSQANPAFPDGIPTIWGGLDTWAQVLVVVAIVAVVFLALRGDRAEPYDRTSALTTAVIGVALLIYAVVKWAEAADDAEALQNAFAQAAQAGAIPAAFTVETGIGFLVVIVGTALVAIGGVLGLMASSRSSTA